MAGWSSGWVAAAGANTSTLFNHTLNSTDVTWQIYVAEDDQGSNAITLDVQLDLLQSSSDTSGAMLTNITETSFNLQLGSSYIKDMFLHTAISFAGKYVKVVATAAISDPVPGTGDLCKILSEDSGYQMFRNGLTIQWMSSPAFITESSQVVDFPIAFAAKPLKVTASTRYPSDDGSSQQWIQVVTWDATSVTVRAQSQNVGTWTNPVFADIIAIGIAEVTDCPGSTDPNDPSDPKGIKISQLTSAAELKDDDLFVISKENTGDGIYDISQKVTLEDLSTFVTSTIPEPSSVQPSRADYHLIQTGYRFHIGGFTPCWDDNVLSGPGLINGSVVPAEQVSYTDILLKLGYIEEAGTITTNTCNPGMGFANAQVPPHTYPAYRITELGGGPGTSPFQNGSDPRTGFIPKITVLGENYNQMREVGDIGWEPYLSQVHPVGTPRVPTNSEIMLYLSLL
tara:strand:+ start:9031 stop:10392 length:1362 start_codon:yes stop_codon:yes gene_type:complete